MEDRIVSDAGIMLGKPCVRGTRITVELILELLAGGRTVEEVLEAYQSLERADILAALQFAAESVRVERIAPAAH